MKLCFQNSDSVLDNRYQISDILSLVTLSNNFRSVSMMTPQFQLCSAPDNPLCTLKMSGVRGSEKCQYLAIETAQTMSNIAKCTPALLSVTFVNSSLNNIFTTKKINNHLTSRPQPSSLRLRFFVLSPIMSNASV